jgi:uncharacterized protein
MAIRTRIAHALSLLFASSLLGACQTAPQSQEPATDMQPVVHYVEIVTDSVDEQCATLEAVHGFTFGPAVAEMGMARIAEGSDGSLIGVRAPLAPHDMLIVRTYLSVADIHAALQTSEAKGAIIAYPATEQGNTGTWAIYILDGTQHGLWQP